MSKFKVIKKKEEVDFLKMSRENRQIYLHSYFKDRVDTILFNDIIDDDIANRRLAHQQYKLFWENEGFGPSLNFINEQYRMIFVTTEKGNREYDITSKTIVLSSSNGESGTMTKGKIILDHVLIPKSQSNTIAILHSSDLVAVRESNDTIMLQKIIQQFDRYIRDNPFIYHVNRVDAIRKADNIEINNRISSRVSIKNYVTYDNGISDIAAIPMYASDKYYEGEQFMDNSNEITDTDIAQMIDTLNDIGLLTTEIAHTENGVIYNYYNTIVIDYTKHIEDINIISIMMSVLKLFTTLLYIIDLVIEERVKVNPLSDLAVGFKESYKGKKAVNRTTYYLEYILYIAKVLRPNELAKFKRYFDNPIKTLMYLYQTYISTNMQHFQSDYKKIVVTNDTDFADILMKYYKYHNVHSNKDLSDYNAVFTRYETGDKGDLSIRIPFNYSDLVMLKTKKYYDIYKAVDVITYTGGTKVKTYKDNTTVFKHAVNNNIDSTSAVHMVIDVLRKNYINDITDKMLDEIGIPWKTIHDDGQPKEKYYENARMFVESMNYKFHLDFRLEYDIIINKTYSTAKSNFYTRVHTYAQTVKNKDVVKIADFLRSALKLASIIDISDFDIESKKIKNELIKIARTNIFYNLTPEYKIQIGFENLTQEKKEELLDKLIEEKKQKIKELTGQ
jgi:hypothetical protein